MPAASRRVAKSVTACIFGSDLAVCLGVNRDHIDCFVEFRIEISADRSDRFDADIDAAHFSKLRAVPITPFRRCSTDGSVSLAATARLRLSSTGKSVGQKIELSLFAAILERFHKASPHFGGFTFEICLGLFELCLNADELGLGGLAAFGLGFESRPRGPISSADLTGSFGSSTSSAIAFAVGVKSAFVIDGYLLFARSSNSQFLLLSRSFSFFSNT